MAEIYTRRQLDFYLKADRMMNRGIFDYSFLQSVRKCLLPDYIMQYLEALRKASYYSHQKGIINAFLRCYYKIRHYRLGVKLGFDIGVDTLGYGVVIGHPGSIVIGTSNRIGNYAVLHTSTCISNNEKVIGDGLYLSAGVIMTSKLHLGDNVMVGANSLVNKSFEDGNVMIAGNPATVRKTAQPWYMGGAYFEKYKRVEELRIQMGIENEKV